MVNEGAGGNGWTDDVHADAALYAVDALDAAEARAFEEHLADCAQCREEVDSFRGVGAELAGAVAMEPPPELRDGVLGAIRAAASEPAEEASDESPAADADAALPHASGSETARSNAGGSDVTRSDAADAARSDAPPPDAAHSEASRAQASSAGWPHGPRTSARIHSLDARRSRRSRWILAAAAAVIVPGVALGGWALGQQSAQQEQQVVAQEQQRQDRLLAAPDVAVQHVDMDGGGATVIASRDRDAALLVASDFPDPGEGRQYQLWLMDDGTPVPDTTFDAGAANVWLDGDVSGAQALAVTVEPEGGSEQPTSDPLMVAEI